MNKVINLTVSGGAAEFNGQVLSEDLEAISDAMERLQYAVGYAATLFRMVNHLSGSGFGLDEGELCALCHVSAEHFQKVADHEGELVVQFAMRLSAARHAGEVGGV